MKVTVIFPFFQFKDMLYFIIILLVFLVAYGVTTNALLKPRKGNWSMLLDILWHPYFNIYGELFVDDADKGKSCVTSVRKQKIFQYVHVISNERFRHANDQINSKEQQYIRKENNETQSKTMGKIKLVNICVLIRHYMGTTLYIFIFKFVTRI